MNKEEGRIIRENPLRILGVFSDTPKKDIVANIGKLRAFAKTGKILDFDTDFTTLLGPVARTIESIEKANNDIALPKDKLQAGMFWFMQHTDNDKAAIECLKLGNPDEAMTIIQKKGNYSGVVNMAVLALILKKWDIALYSYAYLLESPMRRGALIKAFTDSEDYYSEEELVEYISNKLIQDYPNTNWLDVIHYENVELDEKTYPFKSRFEDNKLIITLLEKSIDKIKNDLELTLKRGAAISRKDTNANLKYLEETKDDLKELLRGLRLALGKTSAIYVKYADKVANQYLNCCIWYYNNDATNPNRARVILKYTRIAYRFAEGKTAKDRLKENLEIIEKACENLIPELIEKEFDAIDKMVMDYHEISKTKDYTEHLGVLVEDAYRLIQVIKDKIGKTNKHYIYTSTNFVLFVTQEVRLKKKTTSTYSTISGRLLYASSLQWGRQILDMLAKFDMDDKCQLEYDILFAEVLDGLNALKPKKTTTQNQQTNSTTSTLNSPTTHTQRKTKCCDTTHERGQTDSVQKDTSVYQIVFGAIAVLMIIVLINICSSRNKSLSKPDNTITNRSTSTHTNQESANSIYSSKTDDYSNSSYNDIVNEDLSKYNFQSDNNGQVESYKTVQYKTGDRPYQSTYGKGSYDSETLNSLLIKNGSSTDAVVFLERTSGKKVRHVFIRKGENFTMSSIPGGEYIIKVMQGVDWNPERDNGSGNPKGGFMKSRSISKSESYDPFEFPYPSSGQYGQFEVTLYKVQNGNMQTETINENELF